MSPAFDPYPAYLLGWWYPHHEHDGRIVRRWALTHLSARLRAQASADQEGRRRAVESFTREHLAHGGRVEQLMNGCGEVLGAKCSCGAAP